MTFNTIPKFAEAFFKWISRIACGLLMLLVLSAPLPAVDILYVSRDCPIHSGRLKVGGGQRLDDNVSSGV